jgi:hypothetical protein
VDPGQSIYFAETGLACTVGDQMVEMLLIEDRNRFVDTLLTSPVRHLFISLASMEICLIPIEGYVR